MLIAAIVTITLALVFYSVGVWAEKLQGRLRAWHVVVFWIGLACDSTGTALMSKMADGASGNPVHAVTGAIAIALMLVHSIWASWVILSRNEKAMLRFHRFSLIVWAVWLIPYVSGAFVGMGR